MNHDIFTAVSGALANEKRLNVISNNLANANTTGYKKDSVSFASMLPFPDKETSEIRNQFPQKIKQGEFNTFAFTDKIKTDFSQGIIKKTGNTFDLALSGKGFFIVQDNFGIIKYTRNGNFVVDKEGFLVTRNGEKVLDSDNNPINLNVTNSKSITIDEDGSIYIDDAFSGKIGVIDFKDYTKLKKIGYTEFIPINNNIKPIKAETFSVHQGYLEGSNINVVKEMTSMIEVLRAYEATQKVITTIDNQLNQKAVNDVGI